MRYDSRLPDLRRWPFGSAVRAKSRLRLYSANPPRAGIRRPSSQLATCGRASSWPPRSSCRDARPPACAKLRRIHRVDGVGRRRRLFDGARLAAVLLGLDQFAQRVGVLVLELLGMEGPD